MAVTASVMAVVHERKSKLKEPYSNTTFPKLRFTCDCLQT